MAAKRPVRLCEVCGDPCRPEEHTRPPYKCRVCKFARPDIVKTLTEAAVPCGLPKQPKYRGEWIVCADLHIPLHDPHALAFMCAVAQKYGIRQLGIAGDLTHYDTLGRFAKMRKPTSVSEDVTRTVQVLGALERVFDTIVVAPGNHDHRVEKSLAEMGGSIAGRKGLELLAAALGAGDVDPAGMALSFMQHFFGSDKVECLELSDFLINDTWLVQHPGTASRVPPQGERRMAHTFRKSIIQGHSHAGTATGFDDSGTDMVIHLGPMCDGDKFRYKRERPSHYPRPVPGFVMLTDTGDDKGGQAWTIPVHPRATNPLELVARL